MNASRLTLVLLAASACGTGFYFGTKSPPVPSGSATSVAEPRLLGNATSAGYVAASRTDENSAVREARVSLSSPPIKLDRAGRVVPDRDLRKLFDRFAAMGRTKPREAELLLQQYLGDKNISGSIAAEVTDLFRRYAEYGAAIDAAGAAPPGNVAEYRRSIQNRMDLRLSYFGVAGTEGFFKDEQAFDQYQLERLALAGDNRLPAELKAQQLSSLAQALPPQAAAFAKQTEDMSRLARETELLRASGASPEAIQKLRTDTLGADAAAHLADLDRERERLNQRLEAYRQAAAAEVAATPGLTPAQRQQAIGAIVRQRFNDSEVGKPIAPAGMQP